VIKLSIFAKYDLFSYFYRLKIKEFNFVAGFAGVAEFGRRTGLKILWELVPVPVRVRPSVHKIIKNEEFII
jgi:hypothetical protein